MSAFRIDIDNPLARATTPKAASAPTKDAKGNTVLMHTNGKPLRCPRCKGNHFARDCKEPGAVKCAYRKEPGHEDKRMRMENNKTPSQTFKISYSSEFHHNDLEDSD